MALADLPEMPPHTPFLQARSGHQSSPRQVMNRGNRPETCLRHKSARDRALSRCATAASISNELSLCKGWSPWLAPPRINLPGLGDAPSSQQTETSLFAAVPYPRSDFCVRAQQCVSNLPHIFNSVSPRSRKRKAIFFPPHARPRDSVVRPPYSVRSSLYPKSLPSHNDVNSLLCRGHATGKCWCGATDMVVRGRTVTERTSWDSDLSFESCRTTGSTNDWSDDEGWSMLETGN